MGKQSKVSFISFNLSTAFSKNIRYYSQFKTTELENTNQFLKEAEVFNLSWDSLYFHPSTWNVLKRAFYIQLLALRRSFIVYFSGGNSQVCGICGSQVCYILIIPMRKNGKSSVVLRKERHSEVHNEKYKYRLKPQHRISFRE